MIINLKLIQVIYYLIYYLFFSLFIMLGRKYFEFPQNAVNRVINQG